MKTLALLGVCVLLSAYTLQAEEVNSSASNQYVIEAVSLTDLLFQIQNETLSVVDAFSKQDFDLGVSLLQALNENLVVLSSVPKEDLIADPLSQEDFLSCYTALWESFWTLKLGTPESQAVHATLDLFTDCHVYSKLPTGVCSKTSLQKPKQQRYPVLESASSYGNCHRNPQVLLVRNKSEDSSESRVLMGFRVPIGGDGKISPYLEGEHKNKHGNFVKGSILRNGDGSYECEATIGKEKKSERGKSRTE